MSLIILPMAENQDMARSLAHHLGGEIGHLEIRSFPDGESFVRIDSEVRGRHVVIVCTLDRPDEKFLRLALLAGTARDLGAARVGLVSSYLPYMRQDIRFNPGEGITSVYFARLLSSQVDWLVTVDPHLHRRNSLSEIYTIPAVVAHAATAIGDWIRENVSAPVVIGPDSESEQWVSVVAERAAAPYSVLTKKRLGDRDVRVSDAEAKRWQGRTPVLVDDIVSTARTMIAAATQFREVGFSDIVAIGVHALFAGQAYEELKGAGVGRVVTCNSVSHASNGVDISPYLAAAIRDLVRTETLDFHSPVAS